MNNLFIIHNTFQLLACQSIVSERTNENNYLLIVKRNDLKNLKKSIELILIKDLWIQIFELENIDDGVIDKNKLFSLSLFLKTYKFYDQIKRNVIGANINSIYLADSGHFVYRNIEFLFKEKQIFFVEEGVSSYYSSISGRSLKLNKFKYLLFLCFTLQVKILMNLFKASRVNYLQTNHSKTHYNIVRFTIKLKYSENLNNYLSSLNLPNDFDLFLTSSISSLIPSYGIFLHEFFSQNFNNYNRILALKFHPAETDENRQKLLEVLDGLKIKHVTVANEYSLPSEYLIDYFKPNLVLGWESSTLFLHMKNLFPSIKYELLYEKAYLLLKEMKLLTPQLDSSFKTCFTIKNNLE